MNCKKFILFSIISLFCLLQVSFTNDDSKADGAEPIYFKIGIDKVGYENVQAIKTDPSVVWWVEAEDEMLVLAPRSVARKLNRVFDVETLPIPVREELLFHFQNFHKKELAYLSIDVLIRAGKSAVVQARSDETLRELMTDRFFYSSRHQVLPFQKNTVLASQLENEQQQPYITFPNNVDEMVNQVDGQKWFGDVKKLAAMNRYSYGEGIKIARDFIKDELSKLPGVKVSVQELSSSYRGPNVIATIEGSERPNEWYIIGAHYDSTSENTSEATPGAEDNASGTAGLLEIARALTKYPPKATIVLIAFSGEEQGTVGSRAYVQKLISSGNREKVKAVIIMDMVGYSSDDDLDCLLETSKANEPFTNILAAAAKTYTTLRIVKTFNYFGSDHVPFIDNKMQTVLTIDNEWSDFPHYHTTQDTPDLLSIPIAQQILRMNVATIALWSHQ